MTDEMAVIDEMEVHAETQRLAFMATRAIEKAMKAAGFKKADIARRLGVPKSRVSKVLYGESNMTLRTLAQFGLACGAFWDIAPVGTLAVQNWTVGSPAQQFGVVVANVATGTAPAPAGAVAPPLAATASRKAA
jgi:predicted XRE-type DNA-binding protein